MIPFADDDASMSIGELTIENGTRRVAIFGQLELTRDRRGLKRAMALKEVLDKLVATLEAGDLPASIGKDAVPSPRGRNPFA